MEKIGKNTSFFELGGDSISAITLISLCKAIDIELTTTLVFKNSTLSRMAGLAGRNFGYREIPFFETP